MKKVLCIFLTVFLCLSSHTIAFAEEIDQYTPEKVTSVMFEKISETSVKITWSGIDRYYSSIKIAGYEVYRYNTADKSYTLLRDVKADPDKSVYSYTAYDLKKATKYVFAVRSYITQFDEKVYSEYSDKIYAATAPRETTITSLKYVSTGKVKIAWKSVSEADGYLLEYSPHQKFPQDGRTCYVRTGKKTTSKTVSGLAKKKYYFRVRPFVSYGGYFFCSDYCYVRHLTPKKGASVKQSLNAIKTTMTGRKYIKEFTAGGVDINKYSTTYDRVKAIYNWHSKNHKKYGWNCVGCNSNFNTCLAFLFADSGKQYDSFINLMAGNFRNNDGSVVMHKWSYVYLAGVPYIVDPRLQGYTSNKTGNTYFFISEKSAIGKKYLFDGSWGFFPTTFDKNVGVDTYAPYYDFKFVAAVKKPARITPSVKAGKGSIKLSWKKVNYIAGYQIQYSTTEDFKNPVTLTVTDPAATAKTITNLKKNKTYYVRIRAFKQLSKSRLHGFWSAKQKVKTK